MTNSYELSMLTNGDDRLARYRDEADHARLAALLPTRAGLLSRLVNRPARRRPAAISAPATPAASTVSQVAAPAGRAAAHADQAVSPRVPVRS